MSIVVSDTSPIRALAHLARLELLDLLFGEVLIPPAVVAELEKAGSRFPPLRVAQFGFLRIQTPQNRATVEELLATLGPGEAEALALAEEVGADAVLIDESAGRKVAQQRGLRPLGVLGILIRARQRNLIGSLAPLLDRLQIELGFYLSASLKNAVLREVGEFEG